MARVPCSGGALDEVLRLATQGWRLIPCKPRDKTPLIKEWPQRASSDPLVIAAWSREYPGCNWAVLTGLGSRVFVLDIDGAKGRAALATLETQHGPLPATLTSYTGRNDGGEHRWFTFPVGRNLRNSTAKIGPALDIKADGGYTIVPPSIHPTGRPYSWAEPQKPIAEAPGWLLELATNKSLDSRQPREIGIGILVEGQRDDALFRLGCAKRRKGCSQEQIETELLEANTRRCIPPLPDAQVRAKAASAAKFPVGGPDPLECAWRSTSIETYTSKESHFLGLCCHLQNARPGLEIALPLVRIGLLMGVDYTTVGKYRSKAVREGLLEPVGRYVPHKRAGQYQVTERLARKTLTILTSGLVRIPPSENVPDEHSTQLGPAPSENAPDEHSTQLGPAPSENAPDEHSTQLGPAPSENAPDEHSTQLGPGENSCEPGYLEILL